jgi:hypothetical protein
VDILSLFRLMNFHLTWNWNQDVMRDIFKQHSPELADWIDDIIPWHKDNLSQPITTILDESDLKKMGLWTD